MAPKPSKHKTQALSLLDGILEETQREATSEAVRLKAELEAKRQRDAEARVAAEEAKRQAAQARIDAELARQQAAEERRAVAAEQLRIEELKAKGLWTEPEPEPQPAELIAPTAPARPVQTTAEVLAAHRRSPLPMIAAAAALLAIGGATIGYQVLESREFVDATTTYSQVEVSTLGHAPSAQAVAFRPIPVVDAVPALAAEPEEERRERPRREERREPREEEPDRIELDLDRNLIRGRD